MCQVRYFKGYCFLQGAVRADDDCELAIRGMELVSSLLLEILNVTIGIVLDFTHFFVRLIQFSVGIVPERLVMAERNPEGTSSQRCASKTRKTVVLVGTTGVGKSSLGNVLLGLHPTKNPGSKGFVTSASTKSCTDAAECRDGFWSGNTSKPVRIFDTPGHGDADGRDCSFRESIAESMRKERYVDAFVWVKNFEEPRFDHQDASFFNVFSEMFGPCFMQNVVVILARYNYSADAERRRQRGGASLEATMEGIRDQLQAENLPIFAVDALHDPEDAIQLDSFQNNSIALWEIIQQFSRQPVANVHAVKTELEELNQRYDELQASLAKKDEAHARELMQIRAKQQELIDAQAYEKSKWDAVMTSIEAKNETFCAQMRQMTLDHGARMGRLEEENEKLRKKYERQKDKVEKLEAKKEKPWWWLDL
ncbi:unnamed protein product [Notodromas monacha]|uniref:AIG1-type G domain-containing protein n=1 Tax=Notodromas monacha TaxID=399045 RepID=A0A7R9GBD0_9CRUS|nr:unnamed protein product [Notodromas monacha]CAG0914694.1 unnamed protein product [Notodromas monacha]